MQFNAECIGSLLSALMGVAMLRMCVRPKQKQSIPTCCQLWSACGTSQTTDAVPSRDAKIQSEDNDVKGVKQPPQKAKSPKAKLDPDAKQAPESALHVGQQSSNPILTEDTQKAELGIS